ncbi:hypothetical protein IXO90_19210 [Xanthomonas oryzae pv. oryzae]|nr:hypothetical protein IXO90_19210 [Xanthomonas oryzae pv. oryzae]
MCSGLIAADLLIGTAHALNVEHDPILPLEMARDFSHRRFDLTRLVPSLLAAAAASKPWSERALRDVTMFTAESAC